MKTKHLVLGATGGIGFSYTVELLSNNIITTILLFFCTLSAFAQTNSPVDKETEVAHKWSVSLPYFIITDPIGEGWNDRTSTQMIELHIKRNLDNKNIIGVKFATWRLFQPMGIHGGMVYWIS